MKLPNAHLALVGREKITDYLLNGGHSDNHGKAQVMDVTEDLESVHGIKYVIDGPLDTPSGKTPTVRTVWIVDRGRNCPRLVTAYPAQL